MNGFYDRAGVQIPFEEWAQKFKDPEYQTVQFDALDNGMCVSTIWLGKNHNFTDGPPLIFETMVFGGSEEYQERYATLSDAHIGHQRIVEKVS